MKPLLTIALGSFLLFTMTPVVAKDIDQRKVIEPEAAQILRMVSDYLGSLKRFTLNSESTIDTIMPSGQQIQVGAHVDVVVQRPNRLRLNHKGDDVDQEFLTATRRR